MTEAVTTAAGRVLRALIWVADVPGWDRDVARCTAWCAQMGYEITAVIDGRTGATLHDVLEMIRADGGDVIVVASRRHLPPDRTPRIEVVADEQRLRPWVMS